MFCFLRNPLSFNTGAMVNSCKIHVFMVPQNISETWKCFQDINFQFIILKNAIIAFQFTLYTDIWWNLIFYPHFINAIGKIPHTICRKTIMHPQSVISNFLWEHQHGISESVQCEKVKTLYICLELQAAQGLCFSHSPLWSKDLFLMKIYQMLFAGYKGC